MSECRSGSGQRQEQTSTLKIGASSAWPSFGAKYYVALVPSQPNCPGAGCRHPYLQTAPRDVPLLLCRLTASPKLPLGLCFLGLVQVEPALLAKWGLCMSAIPALPWVPLKPPIWRIWLSTLSHASQHGQFVMDVRLWISYHVVYI